MLTFDKKEEIKKIYEIKSILGIIVKIEPFRKTSPLIPQCKRCQGFNHTQRFCQLNPRCVRCAEKHLTSECKKRKDSTPLCVNCRGNHPASYRGCEVAKALQKRRNEHLDKKQKVATNHYNTMPNKTLQKPSEYVQTGNERNTACTRTFTEVLKEKVEREELLKQILTKLDKQEQTNKIILERLSYLETNINKSNNKGRKR